MTLTDRLLALAELWAVTNGRSDATLASRVARDGKLFDRLRAGGSATAPTLERFFLFFRNAENWPETVVPSRVGELLDGVDLGSLVAEQAAA